MADTSPPTAIIFDLDGTLVQTRLASWDVFRTVSERHDLGITEAEDFFALFDGNLYRSLRALCRDDTHAAEVKQALFEGLGSSYAPNLIPGIADVVRRLASVATLAVLSSNTTPVIRRILADNGLAYCFSHVFGGDTTDSKSRTIEAFLQDTTTGIGRRCEGSYDEAATPTRHRATDTVLITDTAGDVDEATTAGVRAVGVAWGMHSAEELTARGAEFVALWPQEILSHLLGNVAARPPIGACAVPSPAESMTARATPIAAGAGSCSAPGDSCCLDCSTRNSVPGSAQSQADAAAGMRRRRRRERGVPSTTRPAGQQVSSALADAVRVICS